MTPTPSQPGITPEQRAEWKRLSEKAKSDLWDGAALTELAREALPILLAELEACEGDLLSRKEEALRYLFALNAEKAEVQTLTAELKAYSTCCGCGCMLEQAKAERDKEHEAAQGFAAQWARKNAELAAVKAERDELRALMGDMAWMMRDMAEGTAKMNAADTYGDVWRRVGNVLRDDPKSATNWPAKPKGEET